MMRREGATARTLSPHIALLPPCTATLMRDGCSLTCIVQVQACESCQLRKRGRADSEVNATAVRQHQSAQVPCAAQRRRK